MHKFKSSGVIEKQHTIETARYLLWKSRIILCLTFNNPMFSPPFQIFQPYFVITYIHIVTLKSHKLLLYAALFVENHTASWLVINFRVGEEHRFLLFHWIYGFL